jgi:hypothetical protein
MVRLNMWSKLPKRVQLPRGSAAIAQLVYGFLARRWLILTEPGKTVFEQRQNHFDKALGLGFVVVHQGSRVQASMHPSCVLFPELDSSRIPSSAL